MARIVAVAFGAAARIERDAAWLLPVRRMGCLVPIRRPFPHIADHIEESIAVGRKRSDRRGAFVTVGAKVLPRELAVPEVGHGAPAGHRFVAPRKLHTLQAPA